MRYDPFARVMLSMIFGGVFVRHPKLKFISAENEAGWATHILERADFEWLRYQNVKLKGFDSRIPEKPSEYFRLNIKLTYLRDTVAIRTCALLAEDTLMFQPDLPHGISSYHNPPNICDAMLAGVDLALHDKIDFQTAA